MLLRTPDHLHMCGESGHEAKNYDGNTAKDVVKNNPRSNKCISSESSNMFHYMSYVGVKTSKIVYSYLRLPSKMIPYTS